MNRIDKAFEQVQKEKRIALMPFAVAGFPNLTKSLKLLKLLSEEADLLEIGFPYSDPLADGPVIQAANNKVLAQNISVTDIFKLIEKFRCHSSIPITVLVYSNLVYQRGIEKFYREVAAAGVDGVLIPDLPLEESEPFRVAANKFKVAHICLISTTTDEKRFRAIAQIAEGFLYLTSVLGVTGARKDITEATLKFLARTQKITTLPIAVGFGISNADQVAKLQNKGANGAIVGSRLIQMIQENNNIPDKKIQKLLKSLRVR